MTIPLWDGRAPGSEDWTQEEVVSEADGPTGPWVRNVVVPTLTPQVPEGGADRAVIVCPGGGFHFLSVRTEGHEVAGLLVDHGVAAFVLKYRIVATPPDDEGFGLAMMQAFSEGIEAIGAEIIPLAVADAERAIELVRAEGYGHVTLLGFSAGGRVTAEVLLRSAPDRRPDAAAAIYLPTVQDAIAPADAPPLFVLAAADDPLGIDGSLDLHRAWREAGRPVELHLFERGGHGFGTNRLGLPVDGWPELFLSWHDTLP
jgi:acetyl esterase/lipase